MQSDWKVPHSVAETVRQQDMGPQRFSAIVVTGVGLLRMSTQTGGDLMFRDGQLVSVVSVSIEGDRIAAIYSVNKRDKIKSSGAHLTDALKVAVQSVRCAESRGPVGLLR